MGPFSVVNNGVKNIVHIRGFLNLQRQLKEEKTKGTIAERELRKLFFCRRG